MRNDLSAIGAAVEAAFQTGWPDSVCELLGFPAPFDDAGQLIERLPALSRHGISSVQRAQPRGALACYLMRAASMNAAALAQVARALRAYNFAELQLIILQSDDASSITLATFALGEQLLVLSLYRGAVKPADLETILEMLPANSETGSALAARYARALDRSRVTRRFFSDFAAQRDAVASAWTGLAPQQRRDREQLALLLLSRLMFLYFLQHRGYLGERDFLVRRFRAWQARQSFYRGALRPLFFLVLNRRSEQRPPRAQSYGALPYLNGGLFEQHHLERRHRALDLPDAVLASVFEDLLERYRFTAREASDAELEGVQDVGVDPEMLGRVFEGLMAEQVREATGTFYTPAATVDRLVCNTLSAWLEPRIGAAPATALVREAATAQLDVYQRQFTSKLLRDAKVLDPACGSGAFLLGSLSRIAQARASLDYADPMQLRRETVASALYGVDVQSDAALLCALRLWLALVPGDEQQAVQPLPNLDRRIRQGDSLVDPLDLRTDALIGEVRQRINELQQASVGYASSEPESRPALQRTLAQGERRLARAWVGALQRRVAYEATELRAAAQQKDLFGALSEEAKAARARLELVRKRHAELRRLAREIKAKDDKPFFSYAVHFADAALPGFDVIVCNPPWVRSHNWPRAISAIVRSRFEVCRTHGWRPPHDGELSLGGGNQVDLALLFLERAITLLAPGGALGIILPAKFMRSLSGAAARKLLLEQTEVVSVEDHSLDQRSIFQADAFASLIVARKPARGAPIPRLVEITTVKRNAEPLRYCIPQRGLSLLNDETRSPWLLAPPDVRRALARMSEGVMLGAVRELPIRRGVVSGNNSLMLLSHAGRKLSGLTTVKNEAGAEAIVESACVHRVARGCDIAAWQFKHSHFILARPAAQLSLPRITKYLEKHGRTIADLPRRPQRQSMLCWHDLASTINAVVLPEDVVALNTVYYIPADDATAHLLAAYFNSLPVRTHARVIAERAKDAHFRFFAWTMSLLALPARWRTFEVPRLTEIARAAHATGAIEADAQRELDDIVSRAYGLTPADRRALRDFDAWLRS